jgi:hypothetical protein
MSRRETTTSFVECGEEKVEREREEEAGRRRLGDVRIEDERRSRCGVVVEVRRWHYGHNAQAVYKLQRSFLCASRSHVAIQKR